MNKLVLRNPVLRFKLGNKIRKMKTAAGGGITIKTSKPESGLTVGKYTRKAERLNGPLLWYDENGKPITKRIQTLYNGYNYSLNTNGTYSRGKIKPETDISTESTGSTGGNSVGKGTKGKVTTIKPATVPDNMRHSGKMGGWNRNIGLGTIDDADSNRMLTEMGWQGLTAELVQLKLNENNVGGWGATVDNKWGNQSRNALKGYYNRWLKLKESGIERPAELILISPYQIMLLNQTVLQESPLPMPEYRTYNDYTAKDFSDKVRGLGITGNLLLINWMNTTGAQNYDWKGNNWARQFRSDVDKALNGDYSDTNIRNTFGTQGNWGKGFLGRGDFGDLQNALQTNAGVWNGIYDARLVNLVKNMDFSKLFKHKQGGQLLSRNIVERFKSNFR